MVAKRKQTPAGAAGTDAMIGDRRANLPLAGIFLSLVALLLVPVVIGQQTRALRDSLLYRVPTAVAIESYRSRLGDELAATRVLVATADPAAAEWLERSHAERVNALGRIEDLTPAFGGAVNQRFRELVETSAALNEQIVPVDDAPFLSPDTARVRERWEAASAAAEAFSAAVDAEVSTATAQIDQLERMGLVLTTFLAFLAFASAMVTARLEGQVRAFARQSERARREQQILLQSSGEGVFGIDADGRCTFLNPAGAGLIGFEESEVLGNDLRSLVLEGGKDALEREPFPTVCAFAGGPLGEVEEVLLVRKGGGLIEAECLTSPVVEGKSVRGAVVTIRNIGQRKAMERERLLLLHTEQSLREKAETEEARAKFLARASVHFAGSLDIDTTVNSLGGLLVPEMADSCIIYLVDERGMIQRLQPVHVDASRQQILEQQLERYPPRIDTLIPPVRNALLGGDASLIHVVNQDQLKGVPGDASHQSVIGSVGLQSLIVVPLKARGRVMGAISYGVASSGRTYGQEDLTLAEDLASRAALAIDNARLYHQSQEALRARNEVLGIVSHDLRNPLNAVRFGAQALIRHWPPIGDGEIERNQLGAITKAADRMHRLIRDLLDVAQIDAGKLAVEPSPVPAAVLLDDAIELAGPAATERSIELSLQPIAELPIITVDGERILQVMSNLLNNAIKFSPPGAEIEVGLDVVDTGVIFRVRDQGPGIDPEHIPHIFDRFWKSRTGSGGAGLGLAIARGIVESHGGRIWVESRVGEGSTFFFSIPYADLPVAAE